LVDEFDVIELLDELAGYCVDFLGVDAAGLLLTDQLNRLHVVAASTEQSHLVELFAVQAIDGPSLDCYRQGIPVIVLDLGEQSITRRWPRFVERADAYGFRSVHCLPLRLRTTAIGALTLFATTTTALSPSELRVAQALADTATIAILQQRSVDGHNQVADQLQRALTGRIQIEHAKARLAERYGVPVDDAFQVMRKYARRHRLRLSELARAISTDTETPALVQFRTWADHSIHTTNGQVPAGGPKPAQPV
jgi:GAF domain-containing protein